MFQLGSPPQSSGLIKVIRKSGLYADPDGNDLPIATVTVSEGKSRIICDIGSFKAIAEAHIGDIDPTCELIYDNDPNPKDIKKAQRLLQGTWGYILWMEVDPKVRGGDTLDRLFTHLCTVVNGTVVGYFAIPVRTTGREAEIRATKALTRLGFNPIYRYNLRVGVIMATQ